MGVKGPDSREQVHPNSGANRFLPDLVCGSPRPAGLRTGLGRAERHSLADGLRERGPRRPEAGRHQGAFASGGRFQARDNVPMTAERTELGREIETALDEVLAHVRGETELPCRIADDSAVVRMVILRRRLRLSRQ